MGANVFGQVLSSLPLASRSQHIPFQEAELCIPSEGGRVIFHGHVGRAEDSIANLLRSLGHPSAAIFFTTNPMEIQKYLGSFLDCIASKTRRVIE
jgi:hypothetical protein